jgi:hypothetical protein
MLSLFMSKICIFSIIISSKMSVGVILCKAGQRFLVKPVVDVMLPYVVRDPAVVLINPYLHHIL